MRQEWKQPHWPGELGESFSEITLSLALKSECDLNQSKKGKNISDNGEGQKAV